MNADRLLFVYGTLLDPELFRCVTGVTHRAARARPARLSGYRRVHVHDTPYPTLRRAPGSRTEGLILGPLHAAALARLIAYEGASYALAPVSVETASGPVTALAFLTDPALASARPWRPESRRRARASALAGLRARSPSAAPQTAPG